MILHTLTPRTTRRSIFSSSYAPLLFTQATSFCVQDIPVHKNCTHANQFLSHDQITHHGHGHTFSAPGNAPIHDAKISIVLSRCDPHIHANVHHPTKPCARRFTIPHRLFCTHTQTENMSDHHPVAICRNTLIQVLNSAPRSILHTRRHSILRINHSSAQQCPPKYSAHTQTDTMNDQPFTICRETHSIKDQTRQVLTDEGLQQAPPQFHSILQNDVGSSQVCAFNKFTLRE